MIQNLGSNHLVIYNSNFFSRNLHEIAPIMKKADYNLSNSCTIRLLYPNTDPKIPIDFLSQKVPKVKLQTSATLESSNRHPNQLVTFTGHIDYIIKVLFLIQDHYIESDAYAKKLIENCYKVLIAEPFLEKFEEAIKLSTRKGIGGSGIVKKEYNKNDAKVIYADKNIGRSSEKVVQINGHRDGVKDLLYTCIKILANLQMTLKMSADFRLIDWYLPNNSMRDHDEESVKECLSFSFDDFIPVLATPKQSGGLGIFCKVWVFLESEFMTVCDMYFDPPLIF